jgi:hypothetical protein
MAARLRNKVFEEPDELCWRFHSLQCRNDRLHRSCLVGPLKENGPPQEFVTEPISAFVYSGLFACFT